MSTYSEIIIRVDECVPNVMPERTKLNWLTSLDGMLASEVFGMDIREVRALPHSYPEAMRCEPLIGFPYEEVYDAWLTARIHKANGEDDKYQNAMMLYNEALSTFKMWFFNTYDHGKPVPTWFITAYGMAVKQGFVGSIDAWLASLQGEKGDPGESAYECAQKGGYTGTELEFYADLLGRGKTAYQYAIEGGYAGSEDDFRAKMAVEYASLNHNHDNVYAALHHGHDADYAALNHGHDTVYAALNHGHDNAYAALNHNHDGSYLNKSGGTMTGAVTLKGIHLTEGVDYGAAFPEDAEVGRLFWTPVVNSNG